MITTKRIVLDIFITIIFIIAVTFFTIWLIKYYSLQGIFIFGVACVAAFWGWVIRWLYVDGRLTVSHLLVIWLVATGTIMGAAPYFFVAEGLTVTLENLSKYIMVEVVAGSVGYFLKAGVEHSIWGGNLSAKPGSGDTTMSVDTNANANVNTNIEDLGEMKDLGDDTSTIDDVSTTDDTSNVSGVSF